MADARSGCFDIVQARFDAGSRLCPEAARASSSFGRFSFRRRVDDGWLISRRRRVFSLCHWIVFQKEAIRLTRLDEKAVAERCEASGVKLTAYENK